MQSQSKPSTDFTEQTTRQSKKDGFESVASKLGSYY